MANEKKDITISADQIPPEGSLGLLALGDVGIKLWRQARKRKSEEIKEEKEKNEKK